MPDMPQWLKTQLTAISKETEVDMVNLEILLHDYIENGFEDYVFNSRE